MRGAYASLDQDLAEEVVLFLRRHPSFLADHPDLYRVLTPPARVHGEAIADHMAAMIAAARAQAASAASHADGMVETGRGSADFAARVQDAVLALMQAADLLDWVQDELPVLLGLDSASLCVEHFRPGARRLPDGTIARLLGSRDVVLRDGPADAGLLHAEAAPLAVRDALVRVPAPRGGPGALLAFATRDRLLLRSGQVARPLAFLGRAIGTLLLG